MKIIYMGTPDFAVAPLEAILKAGHEVTAVVKQPDSCLLYTSDAADDQ